MTKVQIETLHFRNMSLYVRLTRWIARAANNRMIAVTFYAFSVAEISYSIIRNLGSNKAESEI